MLLNRCAHLNRCSDIGTGASIAEYCKGERVIAFEAGFDRYVTPIAPAEADPFLGGDTILTDLMTVLDPVRSAVTAQDSPLAAPNVPLVT
jgi:hypothetical protein